MGKIIFGLGDMGKYVKNHKRGDMGKYRGDMKFSQENPLLVLFLLAQNCLWTRILRKNVNKIYFFE
jgi:hypothetical protein